MVTVGHEVIEIDVLRAHNDQLVELGDMHGAVDVLGGLYADCGGIVVPIVHNQSDQRY